MNQQLDTYLQLEQALTACAAGLSASEVHGMLTGTVINHLKTGVSPDLLAMVMPGANANTDQLSDTLYSLYRDIGEQLFEAKENFELLLVDEDAGLSERTESLATWSKGFLLGLLLGDNISVDQLPESGEEIARDLMQIAEATVGEDAEQEEDWALAELHEYVKVGAQLIFEFVYAERAAVSPPIKH